MQAAIEAQKTVELVDCGITGVKEAKMLSSDTAAIEWDRFMRISTTAEQVRRTLLKKGTVILDVGGFDGALALFLPNTKEITNFLKKLVPEMKVETKSYVNKYLWMAWYVLFHTEKKRGLELSRFLKENNKHVSSVPHLYDLLECTICSDKIINTSK